jgi:hypothetical protein
MWHTIPFSEFSLLSAGTTSNEALHAEINSWFRQTQMLHQSTMKLKLQVLRVGKLLAHNSAMYRPTTRQMASGAVLCRALYRTVWTKRTWNQWCMGLTTSSRRLLKASVPLREDRIQEACKVRHAIMKRPSSHPKSSTSSAKSKSKRTAFSRLRKGMLVTQGSKALWT